MGAQSIRLIREYVDRKHLSLQSVRGHSGNRGNEEVERRAKTGINLPDAPVQLLTEVGDVSYHGELFGYPQKSGLDMRRLRIDMKEYGWDVGSS